jgi:RHS repeat-associated protein
LGNLVQEWQATTGTVNTSTTPSVQYAYAFAPSGSNNTDRLTSITYPNGRVITYNYASGVDDAISRLTSISDGATTLESYSYLGLDTVVKRAQGNGITLDLTTPLPYTQGANVGSTATSSGTGVAWTNPSNALASDDARATAALAGGQSTADLTATGFGFSIPAAATVVGVDVAVERQKTGAGRVSDTTVQLVAGGNAIGTNKADTGNTWPTADATATYGGAADGWGAGLTPTTVNASGFGVRVKATTGRVVGATPAVDSVQVTVHYTMPTGDAGDQYTGLDRFGRVVDQAWVNGAGTALDRRRYGYDRDDNVLYADNLVNPADSELYAYDGLNQLTSFQRGTLNSTKTGLTGSASWAQSWDFDALGNWDSVTTDATTQTRTTNKQNEISGVSGATTPTYDANGNLTTDEAGHTYKYDAWNQLVEVRDNSSTLLATYRYDALGRRVRETRGGTTTDLYYSADWQVLEERVSGTTTASYVWSPVYVDALIARDRDTDGNGTLDERLYALQNANWNVVALVNTSGAVVERYLYDPYGGVTVLDGGWAVRAGGTAYGWTYLWQGLRRDPGTGLYGARYRDVSPTLGRPLQADPLGFGAGDANVYRWEGGTPESVTDPTGLSPGEAFGEMWDDFTRLPWWAKKALRDLFGSTQNALRTGPSGNDSNGTGAGLVGGVAGAGSGLGGWGPNEDALRMYGRMVFAELRRLFHTPDWTNWPDFKQFSDGAAECSDHLTFGLTRKYREAGGYDDAVDHNSTGAQVGGVIGDILSMLLPMPGGPLKAMRGGLPRGGGVGRVGGPGGFKGGLPGGSGAGWVGIKAPRVVRTIPSSKLKYRPKERGRAPIGADGKPVELHHTNQGKGNASPRVEMTRTKHRGKGNFGKNHNNTGQKRSKVKRGESSKQHRKYWEEQWDSGRFRGLPPQL